MMDTLHVECRLSEILRQNNAEPFGMIYLDMDNFKDINDRYGHLAGDEALKALVPVGGSPHKISDSKSVDIAPTMYYNIASLLCNAR